MSGNEYKRGYAAGFADAIEVAQKALAKIGRSASESYNDDHYHNDHPEWGDHECEVCGMVTRGIVWPSCDHYAHVVPFSHDDLQNLAFYPF